MGTYLSNPETLFFFLQKKMEVENLLRGLVWSGLENRRGVVSLRVFSFLWRLVFFFFVEYNPKKQKNKKEARRRHLMICLTLYGLG